MPTSPLDLNHLQLTWVLPPLTAGSGGLVNIARAVAELEKRGHVSTIHVLNPGLDRASEVQALARAAFPELGSVVVGGDELTPADILIATSWATCYWVRARGVARQRAYWVQDYEPLFYAAGTEQELAAATYSMGLFGICIGPWLEQELSRKHDMLAGHYNFGVDLDTYAVASSYEPRESSVAFYARPTTPRRSFDLGVAALNQLHAARPDVTIHLFGEDLGTTVLPFPAVQHGVLGPAELAALYARCRVGLVLSMTNLSLIPLEMLAAGLPVVINDAPSNRCNLKNDYVHYAKPLPSALAETMCVVLDDDVTPAGDVSASVQEYTWAASFDSIELILRQVAAGPPIQPTW
jgi:glycosyltransferase involved in cell wall biosynthesis